jgi:single-stranded DNA-binding protein
MNTICISGNLTKPFELAKTKNPDVKLIKSGLAVNHSKEKVSFINLVVFLKSDKQEQFYLSLMKGDRVIVNGEMHNESYRDKENNSRTDTHIIVHNLETFAMPPKKSGSGEVRNPDYSKKPSEQKEEDDNIPFN